MVSTEKSLIPLFNVLQYQPLLEKIDEFVTVQKSSAFSVIGKDGNLYIKKQYRALFLSKWQQYWGMYKLN